MSKYSVLMSVYNKEKPEYLRTSILSMVNQSIMPSEIIVVKDGELNIYLEEVLTDFVNRYPNLFKIVSIKENVGLGRALNIGLLECENELVARMDTDDISMPTRCEQQLEKFTMNPKLSIVGTMIDEFLGDPTEVVSKRLVPTNHLEIYKFARRRSPFNHPTVMFKKSSVLNAGGYSDLRRNQDVELFGRMLYLGNKAENINQSLLLFRLSPDFETRRKSWINTKSYISVIHKLFKIGFSSFWDLLIVSFAQFVVFITPISIQKFLYKFFIRK